MSQPGDHPKLSAKGEKATPAIPPFQGYCQARRLAGTEEYSECLVDASIPCGYRACFFGLGLHCLHPRHREIAAQTLRPARGLRKEMPAVEKEIDLTAAVHDLTFRHGPFTRVSKTG